VSLTVVFRETALRTLARIRSDDKEAFARIRRAIAALADQPHPDGAVAWGGTNIFRLHTDEARILYEVDNEASTVYIINIGRGS
jgi:mRNA-degrading endonuclease RelE of RelBE toxin-antitoxin system